MSGQPSARDVLDRVRNGRAANAPATPVQLVRAKVQELRGKPVAEIRALASTQLDRAKEGFSSASGVAWYSGLAVRFANYERWKPARTTIDSAADSLAKGDSDPSEEGKRTRYVSAWLDANKAIDEVAAEAGTGHTDLTMVLSEGVREVGKSLPEIDWTPVLWFCGGLLALEVLRR